MFLNLIETMRDNAVTEMDIARVIGCNKQRVIRKIIGIEPFTFVEAMKIKEKLFPEGCLEYLFETRRQG